MSREWDVRLPIVGTMRITVEADDRDEAIAEAMALREKALAGELSLEEAEVEALEVHRFRDASKLRSAVSTRYKGEPA